MIKPNKFYVCNDCGQTHRGKRKPKICGTCNGTIIGELQIKW